MKRILKAYCNLLSILYNESPFVVIAIFASAIITGAAIPISVWVNSQVFNLGLSVASGDLEFIKYVPYLVLFVLLALIPALIGDLFNAAYIRPRCELIIRTAYKGKMLKKLKMLRYEHLENENSMKIIDSVYKKDNGAEESASNMSRIYLRKLISSTIASLGVLYLIASVRWYLLITILLPFTLDTYISLRFTQNIYFEMKKFWKKDRQYGILGRMLMSRKFVRENTLFGSAKFLINTYRDRFSSRNREYEQYFFKHMKQKLLGKIVISFAQIVNSVLLLMLYLNGHLSIGSLIALTLIIFTGLFDSLKGVTNFFQFSGRHISTFEYYEKYFSLTEDTYGCENTLPNKMTIEFDNIHFTYPATNKKVLNGLSFKINHGDKVSIVGKNGEGKTTIIKLLLGLFQPDSGEIRIGGKPLNSYSKNARRRLFGPIFQDFIKYSMTVSENVGIGDISKVEDTNAITDAINKARAHTYVNKLPNGKNTLLGRDFEGGIDLSGGEWQRIAIARAFMGNKPILILDEPTSQLDPMAESKIYTEFAEMAKDRTAIFITHRLASTVITDNIIVISNGKVALSGSHNELMQQGGLYADMFSSQKKWYLKSKEEVKHA